MIYRTNLSTPPLPRIGDLHISPASYMHVAHLQNPRITPKEDKSPTAQAKESKPFEESAIAPSPALSRQNSEQAKRAASDPDFKNPLDAVIQTNRQSQKLPKSGSVQLETPVDGGVELKRETEGPRLPQAENGSTGGNGGVEQRTGNIHNFSNTQAPADPFKQDQEAQTEDLQSTPQVGNGSNSGNGVDQDVANGANSRSFATVQHGGESAQNGVAEILTRLDQLSQELNQLSQKNGVDQDVANEANSRSFATVQHGGESAQNGVAEILTRLNQLSQELNQLSQKNGVDQDVANGANSRGPATVQHGGESAQNGVAEILTRLNQLSQEVNRLSQKLGQLSGDELKRSVDVLRSQMPSDAHNQLNPERDSNGNRDDYKAGLSELINVLQQQIDANREILSKLNLPVTRDSSLSTFSASEPSQSGERRISETHSPVQTAPFGEAPVTITDTLTMAPQTDQVVGATGVDDSTNGVDQEGKLAEMINATANRIAGKLDLTRAQKFHVKEIIATYLELEVARQRYPSESEERINLEIKYLGQLTAFEEGLKDEQKQKLNAITPSEEGDSASDDSEDSSGYSKHIEALFLSDEDYKKIRTHYRIDTINFDTLRGLLGLNNAPTITRL